MLEYLECRARNIRKKLLLIFEFRSNHFLSARSANNKETGANQHERHRNHLAHRERFIKNESPRKRPRENDTCEYKKAMPYVAT